MKNARSVSVNDFRAMKVAGEPITSLTAYDSLVAGILDRAGIDMLLVGDSLGNVFQGRDTTIPVTLDEMIYHGAIVARSVKRAFVVVDMPFMSFQVSTEEAVRNAGRILKETGCNGVKLEGGRVSEDAIRAIVRAGIPVLGHIGLTPQSVHAFGGYGVRGTDSGDDLMQDAKSVQDAGAFGVVLEKIPRSLAGRITGELSIPTIGIGAGPECDGQILVNADMLGLTTDFNPKFVRRYARLAEIIADGAARYIDDVRKGTFPSGDESYD